MSNIIMNNIIMVIFYFTHKKKYLFITEKLIEYNIDWLKKVLLYTYMVIQNDSSYFKWSYIFSF